jgi:hypothetical protein
MYDVYWLAMMLLFTRFKNLESISNITIMHNDNNNRTQSILNELTANLNCMIHSTWNKLYIYKVEPSFRIFFKERGARINWGTYYALNGHIA